MARRNMNLTLPGGGPYNLAALANTDSCPAGGRSELMARVVFLQFLTTFVVAGLAWLVSGRMAAVSALLGGLACAVPNGLFALRLVLAGRRGEASPVGFLLGEFVKVVATVALLALIAKAVKDLNWLAMIVAIIAVLNSYVLALTVKH